MNPGDHYGRYQVIRLIGRGAMGEVYLARDTQTQRQVALKIVYNGPDAEDHDVVDAERLGAELQKRLSGFDRRVVLVNRYGEINGDLFIEMEYIEGEDLSTILARGPLTPGFATHIAIELCEMLENLNAFTTTIADRQFAGIVHGDLKPRNVRLNTQNQVKALDFGIAKALSHTRKATINVFASTAYCSPERIETQNMDSHSDLWSVGVLLYQMLAGRLPFDEPNKERLERRIRSSIAPLPLPASCPEPLSRVVFKMLSREQSRRYQNASDVKAELERFRRGEAVLAEAPPLPGPDNPEFDSDATVRTTSSAAIPPPGDDATVRTTPRPVTSQPPPMNWPPKRQRSRNSMGCLAAFGVVFLMIFSFILIQWNFWNEADKLKSDLQTERATNLDDAWDRYQALSKRMHLGMFLWGAKSALKKRLIQAADETIGEYRNSDAPSIYEPQWIQARNTLYRGLQLDPEDNHVKGRYRLCEGHVARIDGERARGATRQKLLDTAIARFNEAAELLKKSPDPYLGLARLYVYDMIDLDRAEEALNNAEKYGHPKGRRETAQLADGYLRRADRFWKQSRGLASNPDQERDFLIKAHQDYIRSQQLYQQVGLYGDALRNQLIAVQGQQRVEQRLDELQTRTVSQ